MKKAIYKIVNKINNKIYIGQTIHPEKRWQEHCQHARLLDDKYPIHLAIAKYGPENFTFEVIEWSENYDNRENELIQEYNSKVPNGYNLIDGGHSPIMLGEEHPRNKVKNSDLPNILQDLKNNVLSDRQIATKYNLTDKIIADINNGITHKQENIIYPIRKRKGRTGGIDMITRLAIIDDLKNTSLSYAQLAKKYNLSKGMIGHINCGRYNPIEGLTYPIRNKE